MTVIGENFTGNHITLESVLCGLDISVRAAAAVMFFSCVLAVVSSDKIVYLFGRISPRLSLFLSILLRTAPRLRQYARRVSLAQGRHRKRTVSGQYAGPPYQFSQDCVHSCNMAY